MKRRVLLATNSRDRGSTSRTLESWARLLPAHGIEPIVTIGGEGPLLDALRQSGIPVYEHPIRFFFERGRPLPFLSAIAKLAWRIRRSGADLVHVNEHEHYPVVARAAYLAGVPTFVHIRVLRKEVMGDDRGQDAVSQELQPFVEKNFAARFHRIGLVRQGFVEEFGVFKTHPEDTLEFLAGRLAIRCFC